MIMFYMYRLIYFEVIISQNNMLGQNRNVVFDQPSDRVQREWGIKMDAVGRFLHYGKRHVENVHVRSVFVRRCQT